MSKPDCFDSSRNTLDWAAEAIDELKSTYRAFFSDEYFRKITEFDPETREDVVKVVLAKRMPSRICRKTTEALSNIRHAFDQSLFGACWAINRRPKESIYFPWAQSPTDLEYRLGAKGKPGKIPPELWPVLRLQEPYPRSDAYPGGEDLVRALAHIANTKHTVNLDFSVRVSMREFSNVTVFGQFTVMGKPWDPVKNEIELVRLSQGSNADYDATVHGQIVFAEAPPLAGVVVAGALERFLEKANATLEALKNESLLIGKL